MRMQKTQYHMVEVKGDQLNFWKKEELTLDFCYNIDDVFKDKKNWIPSLIVQPVSIDGKTNPITHFISNEEKENNVIIFSYKKSSGVSKLVQQAF